MFLLNVKEVAGAEINANENQTALEYYLEKRKTINNISDSILGLAGFQKNSSSYQTVDQVQRNFNDAYSSVYSNYQEEISGRIKKHADYQSISTKTISPTLSQSFLEKAIEVIVFATVLSVIFVFIFLRQLVPSIAVITGAAADITIAVGAMGFFGIPITISSLAAILMLIGFSLDTDILLTMRMFKRGGDPRTNAFESMKTGMTMSISSIIAFSALFGLATLTNVSTYHEISSVALAGLVGDLFATWGINAVMLLWYVESRK